MVALVVAQYAVEHQYLFAAAVYVPLEARAWHIAHYAGGARNFTPTRSSIQRSTPGSAEGCQQASTGRSTARSSKSALICSGAAVCSTDGDMVGAQERWREIVAGLPRCCRPGAYRRARPAGRSVTGRSRPMIFQWPPPSAFLHQARLDLLQLRVETVSLTAGVAAIESGPLSVPLGCLLLF